MLNACFATYEFCHFVRHATLRLSSSPVLLTKTHIRLSYFSHQMPMFGLSTSHLRCENKGQRHCQRKTTVCHTSTKKKKKMRLRQDLPLDQVRAQTPNPLTRRELLSQISGLYDPVGLVTPAKQNGAILVQRAFQEAKRDNCTVKDSWDTALSDSLREDAIQLFEEYVQFGAVTITRAITLPSFLGRPWAVTFSDGSEHAYSTVMDLRWNTDQNPVITLESKAKLTP